MISLLVACVIGCADLGPLPAEAAIVNAVVLVAPTNLSVPSGGGQRNTLATWTNGDATATVEVWINPGTMTAEQAALLGADGDGFYKFATVAAGQTSVTLRPLGLSSTYRVKLRHVKPGDTSPFSGEVTFTT